ncbi:GNAT family N-acetyltransferase [Nocardioides speluncae]|uniref:GNAT family N-acetyltransferase n=1 Tax=Nocardioides speluncae TaxID=2670337 RepID=UPI00197F09B8|nr:GNAT family protein [Nocardioides speluncae]
MTYLLAGTVVGIRKVEVDDVDELVRLARESVELHRRWATPPQTEQAWAAWFVTRDPQAWAGLVICEIAAGAIVGQVNVNNIVYAAFRSAALGYNVFASSARRGFMTQGLGQVIRYAFAEDGLALHRLEANIQPDNAASIALVKRLGFRLEGLSPDFLFLDGAWRDHERWAITSEMV